MGGRLEQGEPENMGGRLEQGEPGNMGGRLEQGERAREHGWKVGTGGAREHGWKVGTRLAEVMVTNQYCTPSVTVQTIPLYNTPDFITHKQSTNISPKISELQAKLAIRSACIDKTRPHP